MKDTIVMSSNTLDVCLARVVGKVEHRHDHNLIDDPHPDFQDGDRKGMKITRSSRYDAFRSSADSVPEHNHGI